MSSSLTNESKNNVTFNKQFKRTDIILDEMKDLTFNDQLLDDGTLVKDTTFLQLQASTLALESKNTITPTYEAKN